MATTNKRTTNNIVFIISILLFLLPVFTICSYSTGTGTGTGTHDDDIGEQIVTKLEESAFYDLLLLRDNTTFFKQIRQQYPQQKEQVYKEGDEEEQDETRFLFPCQPRNIHLTLGDRQNEDDKKKKQQNSDDNAPKQETTTSMRLSFSLPKRVDSLCDPDRITIQIEYTMMGRQQVKEQQEYNQQEEPPPLLLLRQRRRRLRQQETVRMKRKILEKEEDQDEVSQRRKVMDICFMNENDWKLTHYNDTSTTPVAVAAAAASSMSRSNGRMSSDSIMTGSSGANRVIVRQYDTVSPITGERYSSDYIYHVALQDLQHDSQYSYRIFVQGRGRPSSSSASSTTTSTMSDYNGGERSDDGSNDSIRLIGDSLNESHRTNTFFGTLRGGGKKHEFLLQQEQRRNLQNGILTGRNVASTHPAVFKTPPLSRKRKPVKLAIVGDLGQTYNSTVTMLHILSATGDIAGLSDGKPWMKKEKSWLRSTKNKRNLKDNAMSETFHVRTPVSALLIAGDMSYANTIQPQWDNWFNLIQPIATRIPMMVAAGNHEIECDAESFIPFLAYENRFYMPNRIQEAQIDPVQEKYRSGPWGCSTPSEFMGTYDYGNAYYSFEYGMVKTIVLSSYSDTRRGSKQYNWLVQELESVDRDDHPWLLVMMHTQFYTTFKAHNNEEQTVVMREAMEELFFRHGVNFVFSGHDHAYMRSKPMFRGEVVENGKAPVYIIVGEGGNREGHVKNYINEEPEEWVAVRDKTVYGFGTLEVLNATVAYWNWNMNFDEGFNDDVVFHNPYLT